MRALIVCKFARLGIVLGDGLVRRIAHACFFSCCARVPQGGEVLQRLDHDRGCFSCALGGPDRTTLFAVAQVWRGTENMADSERTGQVLGAPAPAAGAGWPSPGT